MSMSAPSSLAPSRKPDCMLRFEGEEVPAVLGEPVAVALFAAETRVLSRSIKYHRPRSFFCLAGHCGACLMRIDGVPNVKACRAPARDGLVIERQNAFPSATLDVLGAADWFFPKGMDHHTLMTSSTALNALMRKVVRELGGLGRLPDEGEARGERPASSRRHVEVAIVGGGPAGLSAAIAIKARSGGKIGVLVVDEGDRAGGSLLSHPRHGGGVAKRLVDEALGLGVEVRTGAAAAGYYPEDEGGVLAVDDRGSLLRLSAERYVYATGGYDVNALFGDNDRPGICAGRAVGTLLVGHGVVPGQRPLVLGDGEYAASLAEALAQAGCEVSHVDGRQAVPVAAGGHTWVKSLDVLENGASRKIRCDLIAVCATPAPASELARQHGAKVAFTIEGGGFGCVTDERGRTDNDRVFACGDVCGYGGVARALESGTRVGQAVAASLAGGG